MTSLNGRCRSFRRSTPVCLHELHFFYRRGRPPSTCHVISPVISSLPLSKLFTRRVFNPQFFSTRFICPPLSSARHLVNLPFLLRALVYHAPPFWPCILHTLVPQYAGGRIGNRQDRVNSVWGNQGCVFRVAVKSVKMQSPEMLNGSRDSLHNFLW